MESLEQRIALAADFTFFSGTIGVDGTVAGGENVLATNIASGTGGVNYDNLWTGANPIPGPGTYKLSATGFFPVVSARTGLTNLSLNTGNRLVAVYAFEGAGANLGDGTFLGDFDPSATVPGGTFADGTSHGIINIYSFGATNPGLSDVDPTTWVPGAGTFLENINNSANLVAQLRITDRATGESPAYRLGPPGVPTTTLPAVIDEDRVNSIPLDANSATLRFNGDLKLVLNPNFVGTTGDVLNLLFNDPFAQPDFDGDLQLNDLDPVDAIAKQSQVLRPSDGALVNAFDLFTAIEQLVFDPQQQAQPVPSAANVAAMNVLFDALLDMAFADDQLDASGNHLFSDEAAANGNSYNTSQNLLSGDVVLRFVTASSTPGAQFKEQAIKEGRKYEDLNADGDDEGGTDPGLAGWTILAFAEIDTPGELTQAEIDAGPAATYVTDPVTGNYSITLDPGAYIIVEEIPAPPPEWFESPDDDTTEVNPNELGGYGRYGYAIELVGGEIETGNDFGNYREATKEGRKYNDEQRDGYSGDGVDDNSDEGLNGWTIAAFADNDDSGTLSPGDTLFTSDVTSGGGFYSLEGLTPGQQYIIVEQISDQLGWFETPDKDTLLVNDALGPDYNPTYGQYGYVVTLESGETEEGNDFGNWEERREGLTPGFWKANAANAARRPDKFGDPVTGVPLAWVDTGIVPDDLLTDVPPVVAPGFIGFPPGTSFEEALNAGGGDINALMRHAAAAYLNAAHPCVDYPLTELEIVTRVNAALLSGDADQIEDLKNLLDGYNNAGADLDQFGRCADDAAALLVSKGAMKGGGSAAYSVSSVSVGVMAVDESVASVALVSVESSISSSVFVDAAPTLSPLESSTSESSAVSAYLALSSTESSTSQSSVVARDVAFDSVAASDGNLLLGIQTDSDDDASSDAFSSADEDVEFEPLACLLDDVFELLSVE